MPEQTGSAAVCFDLDSTLCLQNQSDEEIHEAVFERAGIEPLFEPADVRAVDSADVDPAETDAEFYANLYREVVRPLDIDPVPSLLAELGSITTEVIDESDVSFRPGAAAALEYARERYEVGLITNGGKDTQQPKLAALEIENVFDTAVFCDPVDGIAPKPATEPFELAVSELSAGPRSTVYIGDSHSSDIVGAHRAGLQSVWVPPDRPHGSHPTDPEPEPTHHLQSLSELSTVL